MFLKSFLCVLFLVAINANYYTIDTQFNVRHIPEELVEYMNQQDNILATTQFIDDRNNSGWTYYTAQSNANYADWLQTYSVGYMEGYLAWELIWGNYNNKVVSRTAKGMSDVPANVTDFIHKQTKWMAEQIVGNLEDNYWNLVNATLALQVGLYDGYIVAITKHARLDLKISYDEFYLLSYWTDLGDVVSKFSTADLHMPRCSFLLKLINNNESLIGSHVTWTDFTDLLRTYKVYTLNLKNPLINTKRMSFSSAPGQVPSIDDYYILDNGRVVTETTIGNNNPAVYDWIHYDSIPYWVRITVTNLAYTDQESWANLYYKFRSGTYNNNWIVIDFKQFNATKANLANATNIVWYIEEFYSLVSPRDVTQELLVTQGYAASYNVPYNATLQVLSQDATNYTSDDRYFLFKKYAPGITDLSSFQQVMRMNNYSDTHDYCEAIASRCDLNQSTILPWGAVDCKLTTDYFVDDHQGWIISGPTAELEAPFSWGDWPQYVHNVTQMPEVFNYNWTFIDPSHNFTVIPVALSKLIAELIQ